MTTKRSDEGLAEPLVEGVRDLFNKFPEARSVSVKRFTPDRKWESLGSVPEDIMSDDYMVNEFGPGLYTLFLRDEMGKLLTGSTTIRIGDRASRGKSSASGSTATPEPAAVPAGMPIHAGLGAASAQIELLKAELERRDAMMLHLIDAISRPAPVVPAAPATTLPDIIAAVANIQKLAGAGAAAPPMSFPEKLLDRAFTMVTRAPAGAGSGGSGNEVFDFVREVWQEMKPMLMAPPPPPAAVPPVIVSPEPAGTVAPPPAAVVLAPAAAATSAAAPLEEEVETVEINLEPWLENLKDQCRKGIKPEIVAGFIESQCKQSEETAAIVEQLAEMPIEGILAMDPEFMMPGYKIFFTQLHEALRVRILGSAGNSIRAGRNGTDA